jgi:transcriptional regulator with XRE-family HTH domain
MEGNTTTESSDLANKIARLVEERGWNQEEFARITRLNRHTVRQILLNSDRRLRNATTSACAKALGLSVNDLRTLSLEQLLARIRAAEAAGNGTDPRRRLREESSNTELLTWAEQNPERVRQLTTDEVNELLSYQTAGAPPSGSAIERFVDRMERRRTLVHRVAALAGTEHLDLLEQFVALLYEKMKSHSGRP